MCEVNSITRFCGLSMPGLIKMYMIDIKDIITIPVANENDWTIENDIVLKPGTYFKTIAFAEQSAGLNDGLIDALGGGFKKALGLKLPRYGNISNKWVYDMVGTRFISLI